MNMLDRSIVIVIEDDLELAALMKASLESVSYEVFCTADPDEGFRLVCEHRPKAVILDLTLNGAHSDGVYRDIQSDRHTSVVPIIICTVHREDSIRKYLRAIPTHMLFKPFHICELINTLESSCK